MQGTSNSEVEMEVAHFDKQGMFDFNRGRKFSGDDVKKMTLVIGVEGLEDGVSCEAALVVPLLEYFSGRGEFLTGQLSGLLPPDRGHSPARALYNSSLGHALHSDSLQVLLCFKFILHVAITLQQSLKI